ncbi:gliding motility-associated C-terminal domain-containing protein, partial [Bacteroidales bacterium OttesenSCG-928-A14]|nr:gliding motility-associated C-terminal domain-containing protein [Bacteroidales bacterium OttesenSCG-928-A14]
TYYLLAFRPDTALVKNGDFEQGNVGFTSAYTYNPTTTVMPEGHYNLVTNGTLAKSDWMNIGDHTTGNGLFMAINAAVVPNVTIWAQSVPVQPNTRYVFYAWVSTMIAREVSEAPLLQFSINNILLDQPFRGPFPITNGWEQFYTIWDSGNNTTANIKIVNQSTVSWGNDLGLDDIFFAIIKPDIDSVTIVVGDPSYSYDTVSVCHNTSHVFIDTIIVEPGDYVRQLYTVNGCDSFIHLRVNFYPEMAVDLGEDQIICKQDSTSTTLQVPDIYYKYLWSTGDTTHSIRVSESGTYYITVYNEIDCFASDEVQITFVEKPDVVIENLTENFCLEYKSQLKVETPLPDILWSTGDITNEIEVTKFGTYYVTVSEHHCSAMDSAIISFCCPVNPGIPNVITPSNNDGVNDIFKYLEDFPFEAYRLIIYDRWGKVVYKTSNPEAFWDGTVNGSILKGLYYYVIELEDGCAFHGSLTVL